MARTKFPVEVLTPEGEVFNDEVEMISTRTATGSIGILANHVPVLARLLPTELRLHMPDGDIRRWAQAEGWLQVFANRATVLVGEAIPPESLDTGELLGLLAEAGADVLVPHMGLTTGGAIGAQTGKTLDESVRLVQSMHDAAKSVNPDILVLCHGGPIAEPDDATYVLANTEGVVGFFGASSMERLPTEIAMTQNMRRFKSIPIKEKR